MPDADLSRKIEKLRGLCVAALPSVGQRSSLELEIPDDPGGPFVVVSCHEEDKSFPIVFRIVPPDSIQVDRGRAGFGYICSLGDPDAAKRIANAIKGAIEREFG
jgi:hypothetical protein